MSGPEHPADDAEAVAKNWLRKMSDRCVNGNFAFDDKQSGLTVYVGPRGQTIHLVDRDSHMVRLHGLDGRLTRGHVRRLCAALGIPLTPKG